MMNTVPVTSAAHVLVTGSSGFVGRHFCSRYGGIPLADGEGQVDLLDPARVRSAIAAARPEAVLHLAAQSSVAASFENPEATFSVNFFGTLHLLEALNATEFRGVFLYVGSADVYGKTDDTHLPITESQQLRPLSPYAVSKVAAEALCYQWSQLQKFRVVLARPFNQIGPGQDPRFAVAHFARQIQRIRRGQQPPVVTTGDLNVTRDFTDVRDVVRAYRMLLDLGENGEVYNVCSGRERSLRSMVERLLQLSRVAATLQSDPKLLRPIEQRRFFGNAGKLRAVTGWTPDIPLETTLADILRQEDEKK
jgi:GDP-4-dehydro-6-deoxy-D-mannose reductase